MNNLCTSIAQTRTCCIALVFMCSSFAFLHAQGTHQNTVSARELAEEMQTALQPHKQKLEDLVRRVQADVDAFESKRQALENEFEQAVKPTKAQIESLGNAYQKKVEEIADANPTTDSYEKAIQQLRDEYEPQLKKLNDDMEAMLKSFEPKVQKIEDGIRKLYKQHEPERNAIQETIKEITAKYRDLIKAAVDKQTTE